MSARLEALARWWAKLPDDDKAHLRRAAKTGTFDERASALLDGKGALWAVRTSYFSRRGRPTTENIAGYVREFLLRQSEPGTRK